MDNNQTRGGMYTSTESASTSNRGGSVYQHFSAPSSTFINVFTQPGEYNVTMSFGRAAGGGNPGFGSAGATNRQGQAPVFVSAQGQGRAPMIPPPGIQKLPSPPAFQSAPARLQIVNTPFNTPEGQKTMDPPIVPPKPKKFGVAIDPFPTTY